jgi:ATP-dependent exoDNAse (exonuclease V) beta subunit
MKSASSFVRQRLLDSAPRSDNEKWFCVQGAGRKCRDNQRTGCDQHDAAANWPRISSRRCHGLRRRGYPATRAHRNVAEDADLEGVYNTERHLLYVACTRARDHLLVTGIDPASEFLDELK